MAGQGTAGIEILEQCPEIDPIIVPVSGGGLIGGVSTAVKGMDNSVKVYGAGQAAAQRYSASLARPEKREVERKKSIADARPRPVPGRRYLRMWRQAWTDFLMWRMSIC